MIKTEGGQKAFEVAKNLKGHLTKRWKSSFFIITVTAKEYSAIMFMERIFALKELTLLPEGPP